MGMEFPTQDTGTKAESTWLMWQKCPNSLERQWYFLFCVSTFILDSGSVGLKVKLSPIEWKDKPKEKLYTLVS